MDFRTSVSRLLLISVTALIAVMAVIKIGDYDIWYHLKVGQYILKTGSINQLDPFSYATGNLYWPVHSWLAAVTFYVVYSVTGIPGLILFNAALILLIFLFIYLTIRLYMEDGGELFFAATAIAIAAFTLRFRMWVRPHIFEFVFLAAILYFLNLYRVKGRNKLYLIPVIQILWTNMHGSVILGLIVPVIYLVGGLSMFFTGSTAVPAKKYITNIALVLIANLIATLFNPDAYMALVYPFTVLTPALKNINEFQPLQLHHLWGFELRYTWGFVMLLILGSIGFLVRAKRFDLTDFLIFGAFSLMAVKGIRFMGEFAIIACPIVFRNLSGPLFSLFRKKIGLVTAFVMVVMIFVAIPFAFSSPTYKFGLGIKENIFPENAVRLIEKADIKGNMLNSYSFGDYIIWRTFPRKKVLLHGHSRSEVFPVELYNKYLEAHESPRAWKELTEKYGITYAVLEYYGTDYGGKEVVSHLTHNLGWVPAYWDNISIVYVKDTPENKPVIEEYGYRYIRPTYLDFSYLDRYIQAGNTALVINDLGRLLTVSPENEEACLARAYVYYRTGEFRPAMDDLKRAILINPKQAMSHSALGIIYMKLNDKENAKKELQESLKYDPENTGIRDMLKRIEG